MVQWAQNLTAVALVALEAWVQSLVWGLLYAVGAAIKKKKEKKKKRGTEDSRRLRTRSDVVASVALMLTLYFFL